MQQVRIMPPLAPRGARAPGVRRAARGGGAKGTAPVARLIEQEKACVSHRKWGSAGAVPSGVGFFIYCRGFVCV